MWGRRPAPFTRCILPTSRQASIRSSHNPVAAADRITTPPPRRFQNRCVSRITPVVCPRIAASVLTQEAGFLCLDPPLETHLRNRICLVCVKTGTCELSLLRRDGTHLLRVMALAKMLLICERYRSPESGTIQTLKPKHAHTFFKTV